MNKAIFPGSFDPFHSGHKYILKQALKKFDYIWIIISWNENKIRKNDFETSYKKMQKKLSKIKNISILINENRMTVDIAKELDCYNLIRGFRNKNDLIYEESLKEKYILMEPKIKIFYFKSNFFNKWKRSSNKK